MSSQNTNSAAVSAPSFNAPAIDQGMVKMLAQLVLSELRAEQAAPAQQVAPAPAAETPKEDRRSDPATIAKRKAPIAKRKAEKELEAANAALAAAETPAASQPAPVAPAPVAAPAPAKVAWAKSKKTGKPYLLLGTAKEGSPYASPIRNLAEAKALYAALGAFIAAGVDA